jgi:hypothetical protein
LEALRERYEILLNVDREQRAAILKDLREAANG